MVIVSQFKCLYLWALLLIQEQVVSFLRFSLRFKQEANCKSVISGNKISVILFMFVGSSAYGIIILRGVGYSTSP